MSGLDKLPSWAFHVERHGKQFSPDGLKGLLEHHRVTNRLGERLLCGQITPEAVEQFLLEQLGPTVDSFNSQTAEQRDPQGYWSRVWEELLGRTIDVPPVPKLKSKTRAAIESYRLLLVYLPALKVDSNQPFHRWFVGIDWPRFNGYTVLVDERRLPGRWILVETIRKPNAHEDYLYDPDGDLDLVALQLGLTGRTHLSWNAVATLLAPKFARCCGLPPRAVRLPTLEEWNTIANLFLWLQMYRSRNLPTLGNSNLYEWTDTKHFDRDSRYIIGSNTYRTERVNGISYITCERIDLSTLNNVGFRFIAIL